MFCFHFPYYILYLFFLSHLTNATLFQILSMYISHFPPRLGCLQLDLMSDLHFYPLQCAKLD